MDENYGTYVDNECFDIHDYDDDTNHDTDDDTDDDTYDDIKNDTDHDTDDGGRGDLYTIKVPSCCSWVPGPCGPWSLVLGLRSLVLAPVWAGSKKCCVPKIGFRGNISRPE